MNVHVPGGDNKGRISAIISDHIGLEGPLLPILHAIQAEFGHVPQDAVQVLATTLNLSRAEIHGVISFYHDFRDHEAGVHTLKICLAEACQSMGGREIEAAAKRLLGIGFGETTLDGKITLEPVYCLGLCATAPAAIMDNELHARLDAESLAELIAEARA